MKVSRLAALALALGSCALTQSFLGMAPGGKKGKTVTYQIPADVYTCGNQSASTLNCDGIPLTSGGNAAGSMWAYASYAGTNTKPYGWGFFYNDPYAGNQFTMDSWGFNPTTITPYQGFPSAGTSLTCNGNCSTFTGTFTGTTVGGQAYTGTMTIDFWYYYSCGSACTTNGIATGGTVTITYE